MPNDAVYAVRQLRKSPAFALAAILTLALGIGANTAIYQVVDAVLFRPLPVREPERLVRVDLNQNGKPRTFSYAEYRALAAGAPAEGVLATSDFPLHAATLSGRGQAHTVNAVIVSSNYFHVLGVGARAGRVFAEPDDRTPVAVISDAFWSREFGRAPDAIGQTLRINKSAITVIGVTPRDFSGETPGNSPDLWVPMGIEPQLTANDLLSQPKWWLTVMARLRPGASLADSQRAFQTLAPAAAHVFLEPGAQGISAVRSRMGKPVLVAMGAVALLLLIACCNLATLLLARGAARAHEVAVRLSLGASRARLVRQLVSESLVLAAAGGALALLVTTWLAQALVREASWLGAFTVEFHWRVPAFTAAATVLTAVLFGIAPALSASRPPSPHSTRPAIGRALIASQIAVSLLLLSGAGMLARSLWNLRHQDFGFRADHMVVADLPWEFSPAMMARYAAIQQPILDRLQSIPGARSVALSGFGPMGGAQHTGPLSSESTLAVPARMVHVTSRYFETTEIPILAGRGLSDADNAGAPKVGVLTETAAHLLFGGANPVGKLVSQRDDYDPRRAIQIVGVARDVRFASPGDPFSAIVFLPQSQSPAPFTMALVRVGGDAGAVLANVRAAFHSVDPDIAIASVQQLPDLIDSMLGQERTLALLANGFGALALLLTAIGVYGAVSYAVERRAREIGIRIALGAQRAQVSGMLLREVASIAGAGVLGGGAAAAAGSRVLRGVLFGIAPGDWSMTAAAALLLAAIAGLAAYIPARRAARLDPLTTLRQD